MTRELNFRQSFSTQFATASGFVLASIFDIHKLPPSSFPGFAIALGDTKYVTLDPSGFPNSGEQTFHFTLFASVPEQSPELLMSYRSDYLQTIENFINTGYTPPIVAPGENYRIVRAEITKMMAPTIERTTTRFSITLECKYIFNML